MLPRQYRVRTLLRGIHATEPKEIVTIPTGATLSIVEQPNSEDFVSVRWDGRDLLVFSRDLQDRTLPC
jgi:hypothetical protein